jgi:hypothetical protein
VNLTMKEEVLMAKRKETVENITVQEVIENLDKAYSKYNFFSA